MRHLVIFAVCMAAVGTDVKAQESDGVGHSEARSIDLRAGEVVYGEPHGITPIHIDYTNTAVPEQKRPQSNTRPPKGNYRDPCMRWVQRATFNGSGNGRWRDNGGTMHRGPWACNVHTEFLYRGRRVPFSAECFDIGSMDPRTGTMIRIRWRGEFLVKGDPSLNKRHCKIISGRGWTSFESTTRSSTSNVGTRPVKNKRNTAFPMKVGRRAMILRLKSDHGYFTLDLTNAGYNPWD